MLNKYLYLFLLFVMNVFADSSPSNYYQVMGMFNPARYKIVSNSEQTTLIDTGSTKINRNNKTIKTKIYFVYSEKDKAIMDPFSPSYSTQNEVINYGESTSITIMESSSVRCIRDEYESSNKCYQQSSSYSGEKRYVFPDTSLGERIKNIMKLYNLK